MLELSGACVIQSEAKNLGSFFCVVLTNRRARIRNPERFTYAARALRIAHNNGFYLSPLAGFLLLQSYVPTEV